MDVSLVVDPDVFERAKAAARHVKPYSISSEGLHAPLDGALEGRIDDAWGEIESALNKGYQLGKEKAREVLNKALQRVDEIIHGAGAKSLMVLQGILQRLHTFNQTFVQGALERFPNQVSISGVAYQLNTLNFTQKIIMSGSLAISLEKVFEMVAEGEIAVGANYAFANAPGSGGMNLIPAK